MIRIWIGTDDRTIDNIDNNWIAKQINSRRQNNEPVCIRVNIKTIDLDFSLGSGACAGGSGGRPPAGDEIKFWDLWKKRGLNEVDVKPGSLISFLEIIKKWV